MNEKFKNYATSSAFRIDLSKSMIDALLCQKYGKIPNRLLISSYRALTSRGLLKAAYRQTSNGLERHGHKITEAGELMVQLIEEAGFSIKNVSCFDRVTLDQNLKEAV